MIAELIAIGDELTSGQRLNTNSQWLAAELAAEGVTCGYHTTLGDDLASNIAAFRIAATRADLVLCTGGLGSTADDLTREAIAAAFDRPLVLDAASLSHIEALFARRSRPMPPRNRNQAMLPSGSRVVFNPHGTAPGIDLTVETPLTTELASLAEATRLQKVTETCRIFALPGVPAEMREMFETSVLERLRDEVGIGRTRWYFENIRLFGIGESDVEAAIPDLISRQRQPLVGITASRATINLRIAVLASSLDDAAAQIESTQTEIQSQLGQYIFGRDADEPWDAVARRLAETDLDIEIEEYGAAALLGPQLVDAYARLDAPNNECRLRGCRWSPMREASYQAVADSADSRPAYILQAGPYPRADAEVDDMHNMTFRISLLAGTDRSELASEDIRVGGHPEILQIRLAKFAAMFLYRQLGNKLVHSNCGK